MLSASEVRIENRGTERGMGAPEVTLQRIILCGDSMGFPRCGSACGPFVNSQADSLTDYKPDTAMVPTTYQVNPHEYFQMSLAFSPVQKMYHTRVVLRQGSRTSWGLRVSPLRTLGQCPVSDART